MNNASWLTVCQRLISIAATKGEGIVLEAEQVQQGRVVIVMIHDVFDGLVSPFIGCSMHMPGAKTSTRHPRAEAVGIVVASDLASASVVLNHW